MGLDSTAVLVRAAKILSITLLAIILLGAFSVVFAGRLLPTVIATLVVIAIGAYVVGNYQIQRVNTE